LVDEQAASILASNGVRLRQFSPPREGLVDLSATCSQAGPDLEKSIDDVRQTLNDENFV